LLTERESDWDRKIKIKFYWTAPRTGWYKLNIDGAFNRNDASGCLEGVFRNQGNWTLGFTMKIISRAPIHAELMALYQGLRIAKEKKLYPLEIETDATQVIKYIKEGCITYDSIIYSCRLLLSQMGTVVMRHNFRQGNEVAHLLAKHAKSITTFINLEFLYFPPSFVMARMLAD
ncbi:putative ribonuclease h protein, partial [Nicotiana attenuata]